MCSQEVGDADDARPETASEVEAYFPSAGRGGSNGCPLLNVARITCPSFVPLFFPFSCPRGLFPGCGSRGFELPPGRNELSPVDDFSGHVPQPHGLVLTSRCQYLPTRAERRVPHRPLMTPQVAQDLRVLEVPQPDRPVSVSDCAREGQRAVAREPGRAGGDAVMPSPSGPLDLPVGGVPGDHGRLEEAPDDRLAIGPEEQLPDGTTLLLDGRADSFGRHVPEIDRRVVAAGRQVFLSGAKATAVTFDPWSRGVARAWLRARSQRMIDRSSLPVASVPPSGENARDVTRSVCP